METQPTEVPEYRTVAPAFFAPDLLPAGSVVRFRGPPGPHLEPLNRAAYEAFEAWYSEEIDELDPKTKQATGRRVRPHEQYRIRPYTAAEHHTADLVSLPTPEEAPTLSLAESMGANRVATDQRPGPSRARKPVYQPPVGAQSPAPEEPAPTEPSVEIVAAEAPSKYTPRRT